MRLPEWKIIRGVTAGWMCVAAFKRELIDLGEEGGGGGGVRTSSGGPGGVMLRMRTPKRGFPTLVLTVKFNCWR